MKQTYSVVLNSDRVHICLNDVPVETFMFSLYLEDDALLEDAKDIAVGIAVRKAISVNDGPSIKVSIS